MAESEKGGRGKKAPYETTHVRVTEQVKNTCTALAKLHKTSIDRGEDISEILTVIDSIVAAGSLPDTDRSNCLEFELKIQVYKLRGKSVIELADLEQAGFCLIIETSGGKSFIVRMTKT